MSSRKWLLPLLLSLPLAAIVLFLGACLPVGLGDPEASKVDARLAGAWAAADGNVVVVLLPFDGRAYLMRSVEVERTEEGVKLKPGEGCFKAWLTAVEGRTFLTAQPLYLREAVEAGAKPPGHFVAALTLSEDGARVEASAPRSHSGWANFTGTSASPTRARAHRAPPGPHRARAAAEKDLRTTPSTIRIWSFPDG